MLRDQFTLPIQIDLVAVFLFGVTGGLAALKRGYDVIGLFALTFVTAVGGGLIRDGIFIQSGPPTVVADKRYILTILLAGSVAVLFREHVVRYNKIIAFLDARGLGAYAVVGMQKAFQAGMGAPGAVLVGMVNASGGGLLRDVLVRDEPLLFKPGQFYVLAAFAGCLLFAVLVTQFEVQTSLAAFITIAVTFLLRMLAIQFNWKSSAIWQAPEPPADPPDKNT